MFGLPARVAQRLLGLLSGGDVADGRGYQHLALFADRTQADFHGKFAAIAPHAEQLQPGAHGPHAHIVRVAGAMAQVALAKALWQQHFHGVADDIRGLMSKQRFHLAVGEHDPAGGIDDDHGVRRGIEHAADEFGGKHATRIASLLAPRNQVVRSLTNAQPQPWADAVPWHSIRGHAWHCSRSCPPPARRMAQAWMNIFHSA
jgi:hypothetical protein